MTTAISPPLDESVTIDSTVTNDDGSQSHKVRCATMVPGYFFGYTLIPCTGDATAHVISHAWSGPNFVFPWRHLSDQCTASRLDDTIKNMPSSRWNEAMQRLAAEPVPTTARDASQRVGSVIVYINENAVAPGSPWLNLEGIGEDWHCREHKLKWCTACFPENGWDDIQEELLQAEVEKVRRTVADTHGHPANALARRRLEAIEARLAVFGSLDR